MFTRILALFSVVCAFFLILGIAELVMRWIDSLERQRWARRRPSEVLRSIRFYQDQQRLREDPSYTEWLDRLENR